MKWPDNNSPLWIILGVIAIGGVLTCMMRFGYRNGFDTERDGRTLLAVLTTAGGIGGLRIWKAGN